MSLLDEAKENSHYYKPTCSVAKCEPDLVKEIDEALAHPDTTDKGVAAALENKRSVSINPVTLGRHRRGDCTCESR